MKKIFLLLFPILMAGHPIAFSQNITNNQVEKGDGKNAHCFEGNGFSSKLMQNREMDYETRTTLLFDSPCWKTGELDSDFFVLLFNYLMVDIKNNEELAESLSINLYNLFVCHPGVSSQFERFINLAEDECREELWNEILLCLFFEAAIVQDERNGEIPLSEVDFFKLFPSLYNNKNTFRIHNIIENFYGE